MHLNIGISRALINVRDKDVRKMRTQNFSQEVLYHLSPTHSIQNSLEMCGIKHIKNAYFLVILNMPNDFYCGLNHEQMGSLADHHEFQDLDLIKKVFDIKNNDS